MQTLNPQTWHYGLMAQYWAEVLVDAPELDFYARQIHNSGQPVLDIACGTGRLLVPLLERGVDIEGVDVSQDMLDLCARRAGEAGQEARLYNQPMHALDLPRRYRTVYLCGAFGLAGAPELDMETLRRCYQHLEHGGTLVFNLDAEYHRLDDWKYWTAEMRHSLPEPWPEQGNAKLMGDGTEIVLRFRLLELNPLDQTFTRQVRLEKWDGERRVAQEEYRLSGTMYFKNEVLLMLEKAGFRSVQVQGEYSGHAATPDHEELVFLAEK
jgi:SAM-dependent methyltransferase